VHSTFVREVYGSEDAWGAAVARSDVRLQWDPDHEPHGAPLERRAIQLGLRGATLRRHGSESIVRIEDVSDFVAEQRARLARRDPIETPAERTYPVADASVAARLGVDS
jgi:hypothetical protein